MVRTDSAGWAVNEVPANVKQPAGPGAEAIIKGIEELNQLASELLERADKMSHRLIGTGDAPPPGKAEEVGAEGLFGMIVQRVGHATVKTRRAIEILAIIEGRL